MSSKVKIVEVNIPNMIAQANPEKTGSSVITQLPRKVVPAVSKMGRIPTATLRMMDSSSERPSGLAHVNKTDKDYRIAYDDARKDNQVDHRRCREEYRAGAGTGFRVLVAFLVRISRLESAYSNFNCNTFFVEDFAGCSVSECFSGAFVE